MKKIVIALLVLVSSFSLAQDSYFGVHLGTFGLFVAGAQVGTEVADNTDVRLIFELWPQSTSLLSSDILYTQNLSDSSSKLYLGAGIDLMFLPTDLQRLFGAHITAGMEFLFEEAGLYFEFQPTMIYYLPITKLKAGINFHF